MSLTNSVDTAITHHTFTIERHYAVAPERVFAAFSDPVRKRRWFGEAETHDTLVFEMDFRVGGAERARFRFKGDGPMAGVEMGSDAYYLDIVPGRRLVMGSNMLFKGQRISASLVTFEFQPSGDGTHLLFTHQGVFFEGADGPEMRQSGWQIIFGKLDQELAR